MKKASKPIRIGLLGPFGYGNLGDAAIQEAVIQNIRLRLPGAQIFGYSHNPSDTEKRHGIRSFRLDRTGIKTCERRGVYRIVRIVHLVFIEVWLWFYAFINVSKVDILVVSGGGQIDDYWGGALGHPYSLFRWGVLARLKGVKFVFLSVGAGPLNSKLSRMFTRKYLSLAEYISYRDKSSLHYLVGVGCYVKGEVFPDLAHSIIKTGVHKSSSRNLVVGIGPMPYFDPRSWPEQNEQWYRLYVEKFCLFISWLLKNHYKVLLFPGEVYMDRLVIDDIKVYLKERGMTSDNCQLMDNPIQSVDELMEQLSLTDIVIASRFHGVLLAHALLKPAIAVSYHEKVDTLMENMGHSSLCLDIRSFTPDLLIQKFKSVEQDRALLAMQIKAKEELYREALAKQYDIVFQN